MSVYNKPTVIFRTHHKTRPKLSSENHHKTIRSLLRRSTPKRTQSLLKRIQHEPKPARRYSTELPLNQNHPKTYFAGSTTVPNLIPQNQHKTTSIQLGRILTQHNQPKASFAGSSTDPNQTSVNRISTKPTRALLRRIQHRPTPKPGQQKRLTPQDPPRSHWPREWSRRRRARRRSRRRRRTCSGTRPSGGEGCGGRRSDPP